MDIKISYHHVDQSESLDIYAKDKFNEMLDKYKSTLSNPHVDFSKSGEYFICEIKANIGKAYFKSDAKADEVYTTFNSALHKLITQLQKQKDKNRSNH